MKSILVYSKFEILQAIRIPMVYVALLFMPTVGMILFVVPAVGNDPKTAALATASMCLFAVLTICSAQYGMAIAIGRVRPWGGYVRTLPGGPVPRIVSMLVLSAVLTVFACIPLVAVGAIATKATATPGGMLLGLLALLLAVVPFGLFMTAVGYSVNPLAVGPITSIAPVVLAFFGGFFTAPNEAEGFMAHVAQFLPTRGPAELVWTALGGFTPSPISMVMFVVWIVVFAYWAHRAYRNDEGKRFA
jgi:ABC-2 type transport system permease protein